MCAMIHGTKRNIFKLAAIIPLKVILRLLLPSPYKTTPSRKNVTPIMNVSGTKVQHSTEKFATMKLRYGKGM